MNTQSPEQRIAELERELEFWMTKFRYASEDDSIRFLGLKDFYRVEKKAYKAYARAHPEFRETIREMYLIVDMDLEDFYFENLPSILPSLEAARRRS